MALEYLRQRDQNIMRNDQFFQSLGLSTLDAQVKGKSARNKDDVPEKSISLYNPEDDEGSNQHDEDEVSMVQMIVIDHYHFGDYTSIIFGSNSSCLLHTRLLRWVRMYVTRMSNILASSLLEVRKASKRVVAPQEQGETTRVTRQRTAANPSLAIVTHDALASTNTTTSQNEEHINNNDEGKLLDQSYWLHLFLS